MPGRVSSNWTVIICTHHHLNAVAASQRLVSRFLMLWDMQFDPSLVLPPVLPSSSACCLHVGCGLRLRPFYLQVVLSTQVPVRETSAGVSVRTTGCHPARWLSDHASRHILLQRPPRQLQYVELMIDCDNLQLVASIMPLLVLQENAILLKWLFLQEEYVQLPGDPQLYRFCFQCGKLETLDCFDTNKR